VALDPYSVVERFIRTVKTSEKTLPAHALQRKRLSRELYPVPPTHGEARSSGRFL